MYKLNKFNKLLSDSPLVDGQWAIHSFDNEFKNKIYSSQVHNLEVFKKIVNIETKIENNQYLAGEIKEELWPLISKEIIYELKQEMYKHLQYIMIQKPADISFDTGDDVRSSMGLDYDVWVNYQKKGEFNPPHNHRGDISFVMYYDIPEIIREESLNSRSGRNGWIQFFNDKGRTILNFNPSSGWILIFPSSQVHQVWPFFSDVTRITIAGNMRIV